MNIGLMRNDLNPTYIAKLTALMAKAQGIDVIYLRPSDVNMTNGTVKGRMLIDNKWVLVENELPVFIDISPYCFKKINRQIMNYLRKNTFLSDDRTNILNKRALQNKLLEDEYFAHLVIPTAKVKEDFSYVKDFLDRYEKIVMKPIFGERGKGVYILEQEEDMVKLGYNTIESELNSQEFKEFFEGSIKNKGYLLQKYVSSRSAQGDPFDCRVHVEKNGQGNWVVARNFIRIGIGQKVISNVNQGGGIADPKPFLKANFGDEWSSINKKLNNLATTLPYKIEELRNTHIMSLGMDVAIDKSGNLFLFEVNGAPTTAPLKAEAIMLRTEYYKFILQNVVTDNLKRESEGLRKEIETLKQEKDKYKKKFNDIENSRTWGATKPIRALGSFVKNAKKSK